MAILTEIIGSIILIGLLMLGIWKWTEIEQFFAKKGKDEPEVKNDK